MECSIHASFGSTLNDILRSVVLHANHFRKDWQSRVRTWFDQPGRKLRRRQARKAKAASLGVRPLSLLRPAVRAQTVRYNRKIRQGRGFTLGELKEAGIGKKEARGIGIVVDHRRRNLSEEGKAVNVERLKAYKTRLIVFPRNSKKPKKADSTVRNICAVPFRLVYNILYRVPTSLLPPPAHLFPSQPPSSLRLPARSPLRSVSSRPSALSVMSAQLLATRVSARSGKRMFVDTAFEL